VNLWGKLLGGAVGFMMGGPLGALLGIAFGHQFDASHLRPTAAGSESAGTNPQQVFFDAIFQIMGYLAKADGRVSENEITVAQMVMAQMRLPHEQKQAAIERFQEGKQADFDSRAALDRLRRRCSHHPKMIQSFVEIQFSIAYADGAPSPAKRARLLLICQRLGFSRLRFEALDVLINARYQANKAQREQKDSSPRLSLTDAYATLGLKREASDAEITKAYRRLLNQHHPDKIIAQNLPAEAIAQATEKTRQIKAAYERIKAARGF